MSHIPGKHQLIIQLFIVFGNYFRLIIFLKIHFGVA